MVPSPEQCFLSSWSQSPPQCELIIALVHVGKRNAAVDLLPSQKTGFLSLAEQVASVPKSIPSPAAKASVANVRRRRVPILEGRENFGWKSVWRTGPLSPEIIFDF
jgi:hypothetical protein